jgi:hypothetical protein
MTTTTAPVTRARTMKALLWKDWRLARSLLIAAGALYMTPIVIGGVWLALPSNSDQPRNLKEWIETAGSGLFFGLIVSLLATPMFGAVMFARERRDRTGELVGAIPLRRGPVVLSKAVILFIVTAVPWLVTFVGLLIFWLVIRYVLNDKLSTDLTAPSDWTEGVFIPGLAVLATGTGWLFSSFVNKDTVAAGLSFFVTLFTLTMTFVVWFRLHPENDGIPHPLLAGITWGLGITSFAAGTIIALRRKTP